MDDRKKKILKLILFACSLGLVATVTHLSGLDRYLDQERLRAWIDRFGLFGPFFYVLLFALAPSLFVPGLPITIAGGVAFGPVWGTVYASIGSTLGAALAFLVSRYFARGQVKELLGPRLIAIDEGVEKRGWIFVAVTRLIPLFPYNLLNYAFGLTRIRFLEYLVTSWICMLPATAAIVVFSSSLLGVLGGKVPKELIIGAVLLLLSASIPFFYRKLQRQKGK